jgi:hypothetical protein
VLFRSEPFDDRESVPFLVEEEAFVIVASVRPPAELDGVAARKRIGVGVGSRQGGVAFVAERR